MKTLGRFVAVLAALAWGVHAAPAAEAPRYPDVPEVGFQTPEEGVSYFAAALKKGDVAALMKAFAINEQADNFDFAQSLKRLHKFFPPLGLWPPNRKMHAGLNRLVLSGRAAGQIRALSCSLLTSKAISDSSQYPKIDTDEQAPAAAAAFEAAVDPASLSKLEVVQVAQVSLSKDLSAPYLKTVDALMTQFGCQDLQDRVVLYRLNGGDFLGGFKFAKYAGQWRIIGLNSEIGGTSADGSATPTSLEDFGKLTRR